MAEVSRKMEGNAKLRRFPQGRMVDQVVLVGGATRMPCVQASQAESSCDENKKVGFLDMVIPSFAWRVVARHSRDVALLCESPPPVCLFLFCFLAWIAYCCGDHARILHKRWFVPVKLCLELPCDLGNDVLPRAPYTVFQLRNWLANLRRIAGSTYRMTVTRHS